MIFPSLQPKINLQTLFTFPYGNTLPTSLLTTPKKMSRVGGEDPPGARENPVACVGKTPPYCDCIRCADNPN